jgi:DNA-directed RNA polymerase specialized sigma subunit, sigma24 homolog
MKNRKTYIENRVQNMFTAYLMKAIHGARKGYLRENNKIRIYEDYLEDLPSMLSYGFKEHLEEAEGEEGLYDLEDFKLFKVLMCLKSLEREIIYLHIFEEKKFTEIANQLNMRESSIKGRYYYAISKIRNRMEGRIK